MLKCHKCYHYSRLNWGTTAFDAIIHEPYQFVADVTELEIEEGDSTEDED